MPYPLRIMILKGLPDQDLKAFASTLNHCKTNSNDDEIALTSFKNQLEQVHQENSGY